MIFPAAEALPVAKGIVDVGLVAAGFQVCSCSGGALGPLEPATVVPQLGSRDFVLVQLEVLPLL